MVAGRIDTVFFRVEIHTPPILYNTKYDIVCILVKARANMQTVRTV